jgi:hypothetical protein
MATRNGAPRRYPLSDKLVTDSVGLDAFEQLNKRFEDKPKTTLTKKEKQFAVINLLKALQVDKRLWFKDGTPVS